MITLVPKPSDHEKGLHENPLIRELLYINTALNVNAKRGDSRDSFHLLLISGRQHGILKEKKNKKGRPPFPLEQSGLGFMFCIPTSFCPCPAVSENNSNVSAWEASLGFLTSIKPLKIQNVHFFYSNSPQTLPPMSVKRGLGSQY